MNIENSYYKKDNLPKCPKCGKRLLLDDIAFNFKGNQDEYWICEDENCHSGLFTKVRYGDIIEEKFYVDEETVKVNKYWYDPFTDEMILKESSDE